jgi:plastocyanin
MANKLLVLGILFLSAVLASGCYNQQSPPPETPGEDVPTQEVPVPGEENVEEAVVEETPSEAKTVTMEITSDGYNPSTITINSGDTIKFVNVNDGPHRVASDPHPIHTDIRGFDSINPLNPGEEYSFTFTEKGTFGCHDHLEPSTRCTIVVQ